jgi:hypothetical protein
MRKPAAVGGAAAAPHNSLLHLSGAMFEEVIALRPLEVQLQSALPRAFEQAAWM